MKDSHIVNKLLKRSGGKEMLWHNIIYKCVFSLWFPLKSGISTEESFHRLDSIYPGGRRHSDPASGPRDLYWVTLITVLVLYIETYTNHLRKIDMSQVTHQAVFFACIFGRYCSGILLVSESDGRLAWLNQSVGTNWYNKLCTFRLWEKVDLII